MCARLEIRTRSSKNERHLKKMLDRIALIGLIIGGINWGSVGLFKFDIVSWICGGSDNLVARIIFSVVGLCALWCVSLLFRERERLIEAEDH